MSMPSDTIPLHPITAHSSSKNGEALNFAARADPHSIQSSASIPDRSNICACMFTYN